MKGCVWQTRATRAPSADATVCSSLAKRLPAPHGQLCFRCGPFALRDDRHACLPVDMLVTLEQHIHFFALEAVQHRHGIRQHTLGIENHIASRSCVLLLFTGFNEGVQNLVTLLVYY